MKQDMRPVLDSGSADMEFTQAQLQVAQRRPYGGHVGHVHVLCDTAVAATAVPAKVPGRSGCRVGPLHSSLNCFYFCIGHALTVCISLSP